MAENFMEQDGSLTGLQHDRNLAVEDILRGYSAFSTVSLMRCVRPSKLNFNASLVPSLTSSSSG